VARTACSVAVLGAILRGTRAWSFATPSLCRSASASSVCGSLGGAYESDTAGLLCICAARRHAVRGISAWDSAARAHVLSPSFTCAETWFSCRFSALSEVHMKGHRLFYGFCGGAWGDATRHACRAYRSNVAPSRVVCTLGLRFSRRFT
jgi:hypothetical protein